MCTELFSLAKSMNEKKAPALPELSFDFVIFTCVASQHLILCDITAATPTEAGIPNIRAKQSVFTTLHENV